MWRNYPTWFSLTLLHFADISAERKRLLQEWFQDYKKTLSCEKCGEGHPACLDFHHNDPSEKESTVCYIASKGYKKERIILEIEKCRVLCANCHRKWHYDNNGSDPTG